MKPAVENLSRQLFIPGGVRVSVLFFIMIFLVACRETPVATPELLAEVDQSIGPGQRIEVQVPASTTPVLVEIRSPGVNFSSALRDSAGVHISEIHLDYLRSIPHYHLIEAASGSGTGAAGKSIVVKAVQSRAGAGLVVRFLQLPTHGNHAAVLSAWKDLIRGLQHIDHLDSRDWSASQALMESAQLEFDSLGLENPALWAGYFSAYYLYFPLYSYAEASTRVLELLKTLESQAGTGDRIVLRILAHQLAGQIQMESASREKKDATAKGNQQTREHFRTAWELAQSADLPFESAWALNNLGISDFYADRLDDALTSYTGALQLAGQWQDAYLINLVATNMAVVHEKQGQIQKAVSILEDIQKQPAMLSNTVEREHLLSLLGNYYLKLYRFPESLTALNEALELSEAQQSSENRGRNQVILGRVYRELGQPNKAIQLARASLPLLEAVDDHRGLRQAHRLLADSSRVLGDLSNMSLERGLEKEYLQTGRQQGEWLNNQAADYLAQNDPAAAEAAYRQSMSEFQAAGFTGQADLARLHACLLAVERGVLEGCEKQELELAYARLGSEQASVPALQADFAWAKLLSHWGEDEKATEVARELVATIQNYRRVLPGVLGAWYWDARQEVFSFYIGLLLASPEQDASTDALLALDQLRNSGAHQSFEFKDPSPKTSSHLRELLAQRDQASSADQLLNTQRLIDQVLASQHVTAFSQYSQPMYASSFLDQLKAMPEGWSLLVYYLAGPEAIAWVGNAQGLEKRSLGPSAAIIEQLERTKQRINLVNDSELPHHLDVLGDLLFKPVSDLLDTHLLVASGGLLSDFPLEAVQLEGSALANSHILVNIRSVGAPASSARHALRPLEVTRLFLAGDPLLNSTGMHELAGAATELDMVASTFAAAEVSQFRRKDLRLAAFRHPSFSQADLVHLASHALIDSSYPELSRLLLSGPDNRSYLTPEDIAGQQLQARLIVLSACETVGYNRFDFDSRLGYVSQLLQQSNGLVLASLWPVGDRQTLAFMSLFYRQLASGIPIPLALHQAKLESKKSAGPGDLGWAAFQLYSR